MAIMIVKEIKSIHPIRRQRASEEEQEGFVREELQKGIKRFNNARGCGSAWVCGGFDQIQSHVRAVPGVWGGDAAGTTRRGRAGPDQHQISKPCLGGTGILIFF
jgi:hypothetical protein